MRSFKTILTSGHLIADARQSVRRMAVISLLIISLLAASSPGPLTGDVARADSRSSNSNSRGSKVSGDLRQRIEDSAEDRIPVIIQTIGRPSNDLLRLLGIRGRVRRSYRNIEAIAIELPPSVVDEVADHHDVEYISFDLPTQMSGHIETTTGAALARNYGTSATGAIDGRGIGIAILDSGVDYTHHAFRSNSSTSRVKMNADFTNEGRAR